MTPLKIQIMLHYYCFPIDFRDGDLSAPAVQQGLYDLCESGMLARIVPTMRATAQYRVTEKGSFYVDELRKMPIPVEKKIFAMPTVPKD